MLSKLDNSIVRNELNEYLKENGIKQKQIVKLLESSPTTISMFLKGQRDLSEFQLNQIVDYIK